MNGNHFAGYLEMVSVIAIELMLARLNRDDAGSWRVVLRRWVRRFLGPKIVVRLLLVIMVIGLILSHSKMANTAFFASMFIAGFIGLFAFRSVNRSVVFSLPLCF